MTMWDDPTATWDSPTVFWDDTGAPPPVTPEQPGSTFGRSFRRITVKRRLRFKGRVLSGVLVEMKLRGVAIRRSRVTGTVPHVGIGSVAGSTIYEGGTVGTLTTISPSTITGWLLVTGSAVSRAEFAVTATDAEALFHGSASGQISISARIEE